MLRRLAVSALAMTAACDGDGGQGNGLDRAEAPLQRPAPATRPAPADPPEPGEPGGLPDDGTPVAEAPFTAESAQGAGEVLQTYFALIEAGRYDAAWKLRWKGRGDDAASRRAFAESFARYAAYHATVGAPGEVQGAAGSLYVDIPVQIYGRMKDGTSFGSAGTITLRRVNDVPGTTPQERRWRIYSRE